MHGTCAMDTDTITDSDLDWLLHVCGGTVMFLLGSQHEGQCHSQGIADIIHCLPNLLQHNSQRLASNVDIDLSRFPFRIYLTYQRTYHSSCLPAYELVIQVGRGWAII